MGEIFALRTENTIVEVGAGQASADNMPPGQLHLLQRPLVR